MQTPIPDDGSLNRQEAEALVADSLARFGLAFEADIRHFLVELAMLPKDELKLVHALMKGAAEAADAPREPEPPPAPARKKGLAGLKRPPGPVRRPPRVSGPG